MKATQGWSWEQWFLSWHKRFELHESSIRALLRMKHREKKQWWRFSETCYSAHGTAERIRVLRCRVIIQTGLYRQQEVFLGCDTVFAWLHSSWKKRRNCWMYFMVKLMVKLLIEQHELLKSIWVINQNKQNHFPHGKLIRMLSQVVLTYTTRGKKAWQIC